MSATLAELVSARSQLAEAVARYYRSLIDKVDGTPWYRAGVQIRASAMAIPARVLKEDTRPPRQPGPGRERDEEREESLRRAGVDPEIAGLYEEPTRLKRQEEVRWDQERLQLHRAVILGAPGGGKTFLAWITALELAQQGLQELADRSTPLDQLPLPICLELDDLARDGQLNDLADAFAALLRERYVVAGLERWLRRNFATNNCWLILDALDQVEPAHHARMRDRLTVIETHGWQCRVLLTCRTANYDRSDIPWAMVTEYDLAPFGPAEIGDFIRRWHGEKDARGEKLNAVVGRSYSLQHACRTPLVTTLACLANEEKEVTDETRRPDLYAQVLRGLLRKAWREDPLSPQDPHIEDLLEMLRPMAWKLFLASPRVNQFPNLQVKKAIGISARKAGLPVRVTGPRDELLERGILVGAGLKENEVQFSFLHRAFQEFLVAEHLSRVANELGWEKAKVAVESGQRVSLQTLLDKKSWLAEWQEVITLLAGGLDDPAPLLELLKNEGRDDLFRHRLRWQCYVWENYPIGPGRRLVRWSTI